MYSSYNVLHNLHNELGRLEKYGIVFIAVD